jgi:hypothetical protein
MTVHPFNFPLLTLKYKYTFLTQILIDIFLKKFAQDNGDQNNAKFRVSCFFFLKKKKNQGMQLQLVH